MKLKRYKHNKNIILLILLLAVLFLPVAGHAQITGIEALIKAGKEDATALTKEYFQPLSSGIGAGVNSGWVNQAKPHKKLGFDIQVRSSLAFVPSSDKSFDISELNLQRLRPADASKTITPTLNGKDQRGPKVILEDQNGDSLSSFNLPPGTGLDFIPAPTLEASFGLIQDTDVIVRFVPKVSLGDYGNFRQYGIGAKHRINSTLPSGNTLPIDFALMAGYNRIMVSKNLNVQPEQNSFPDREYENQEVEIGFDTFTVKVLAGKSIPFLTVYGGIGYEFSSMAVDVRGDYPVTRRGPFGGKETETVTDPVSYNQQGKNGFSGMAGLKIKLGLLDVFADYTLAKYPVANMGVGISLR